MSERVLQKAIQSAVPGKLGLPPDKPQKDPLMGRRLVVIDMGYGSAPPFNSLFATTVAFSHINLLNPRADVVMFEGGTDIDSELYGEKSGRRTQSPDVRRDILEAHVFRTCVDRQIPMIGICRGAQLLTVLSGGKLIQDVTHHGMDHMMKTPDFMSLVATSAHHQMMAPWNLPPEEFQLWGWSPRRSRHYLNGDDKDVADLFPGPEIQEPEIVWYPKTKALAIQGHPEYCTNPWHMFPNYCRKLVQQLIFNEKGH